MAQLGVLTSEFVRDNLATTLDAVERHGLDTVQLQLGSAVPEVPIQDALLYGLDALGEHLTPALAAETGQVLADRGILVAAVDGTFNLIHPDPERRRRNLDHLGRLIGLARALGTGTVTLCTGTREDVMWRRHPANRSAEAWADLVEGVRWAADEAEREGVTLAFEPEINNVVDSAARARRLIEEVGSPAVRVLLDAANLFHRGDLAEQEEHLENAFELISGWIALAHAKDLDHEDDAGQLAAGRGVLDYPVYLSLLRADGYDGAVILHQLHGLDDAEIDASLDHVRLSAPSGWFDR